MFFGVFVLMFFYFTGAVAADMGVVTGSKNGTYIKIGKDISRIAKRTGIDLWVYPSNGSLDNIADVYERRGVQLGIVQSDVLAFIKSNSEKNGKLKRIVQKIKMIYPLYNEEVHILASNSLKTFSDLEGKSIAIGKSGSGTNITASLLFEISGYAPKEKVNIGGMEALSKVYAGEIDAMIYVSGYPVELFSNIENRGVHLVPISDKDVKEFYSASVIPDGVYGFQQGAVDTVAVKSVLMSYDYKGAHCNNINRLANGLYENIGWLRKNGHKKWKNVNLDYNLSGWEKYSCVKISNNKSYDDNHTRTSTKQMLRNTLRGLSN